MDRISYIPDLYSSRFSVNGNHARSGKKLSFASSELHFEMSAIVPEVMLDISLVLDPEEHLPLITGKLTRNEKDLKQLSGSLYHRVEDKRTSSSAKKTDFPELTENILKKAKASAKPDRFEATKSCFKTAVKVSLPPLILARKGANNNVKSKTSTIRDLHRKNFGMWHVTSKATVSNAISGDQFQGDQHVKSRFEAVSRIAAFCGRSNRCSKKSKHRRQSQRKCSSKKRGRGWNLLLRKYRKTGFRRHVQVAMVCIGTYFYWP